jgi:hypothetical protein
MDEKTKYLSEKSDEIFLSVNNIRISEELNSLF